VIIDSDDKMSGTTLEDNKIPDFKWSSTILYRAFIKFVMQFTVKRSPFQFHTFLNKFFNDTDNLLVKSLSHEITENWNKSDQSMN